MQTQSAFTPWWGDFSLDIGDTMHWHFGALELSLQRLRSEWQVRSRTIAGLPEEGRQVSMNPEASPLSHYSRLERCICHSSSRHFRLLPVLADRAVVTRPSTPVHLPRGEKVTLYVSSPLWIRAVVCATAEWSLEMPVIVPSDTWFGASTYDGELCYAARTGARLYLDDIAPRAHRALTQVSIHNKGDDTLLLERLKLPVPFLSLYATENGVLWTESLSIVREQDMSTATLQIQRSPPDTVGAVMLISPARVHMEKGIFVRALNAMFG